MKPEKHARFVKTDVLERRGPKRQPSWTDYFQDLEQKHGKSSIRRPSVMKCVLPEKTYNLVAPILGWEETPKQVIKNAIWGVQFVESETPPTDEERQEFASEYSHRSIRMVGERMDEEGEEEGKEGEYVQGEDEVVLEEQLPEERSSLSSDLEVNPPTPGPRDLDKVDIRANNPYTNFIRRPKRKAARWRPPQKPQTEDGLDQSVVLNPHLSLSQKAAIITDKITKEFCEWLRGLCGMEKTIMTEEVLSQLFEIGFDMPAARSLCVRIQEMSHVTAAIARATNLPAAELHSGLRRELWRDIKAEHMEPRLVAFGRCLPTVPPLRFRPPTGRLYENWLEVRTVPPKMVTMAEVFEGITDLRSVKHYCKWLEANSTLKPQYLVQERMLGPKKKRDIVGSMEKDPFIRSILNL